MWTLKKQGLWTIPSGRFKSKSRHFVPLTDQTTSLLNRVPRFVQGDFVFSTTGAKPFSGFSKVKKRIDLLMREELGKAFSHWRLHDIRRTVRTQLASLRVADEVAEMVIGHGKQGLRRVYDQHSYLPEMREALELWSNRLQSIVEPPPGNVVALRRGL
jgi:integrase